MKQASGIRLIPQPKSVRALPEGFRLPPRGLICISCLRKTAEPLKRALPGWTLTRLASSDRIPHAISLILDPGTPIAEEGYRLRCDANGITVRARTERGVFYGVQTLLQILAQSGRRVPGISISDKPDFPVRGVTYSFSQGRVPTRDRLFDFIDRLAQHKINQLHLLIGHFLFRKHRGSSDSTPPVTPEDILRLDAFCAERHIELVPTLNAFSLPKQFQRLRKYRALCELEGRRRPHESREVAQGHRMLSPAVPAVYDFLDDLFAEYLPLFSSRKFNVGGDEVWSLGAGKSRSLCERLGRKHVYLGHLLKVRDLAARHGKRILFWADMILETPDMIPRIPKDVTALNWGYRPTYKFKTCRLFQKAGVSFYGCPGTSSWVSLFPRTETSRENIHMFSAMARNTSAEGLLTTDWGDGGHYNFMEYSWYGFLFGAEQAWNTRADVTTFDRRFSTLFLGDPSGKLGRAVRTLGQAGEVHTSGYFQGALRHAYFLPAADPFFTRVRAADGPPIARRVSRARAVLAAAERSGRDPSGTLAYLIFAADTLRHAADRIAAFGTGGRVDAAERKRLARDYKALRRRFIRLWRDRNLPSGISASLAYYDQVSQADYGATGRPRMIRRKKSW